MDREDWIDTLEGFGAAFTSVFAMIIAIIDRMYCVISIVFGLILCFISLILRGIFINRKFEEKKYGPKIFTKFSYKDRDPPKPPV